MKASGAGQGLFDEGQLRHQAAKRESDRGDAFKGLLQVLRSLRCRETVKRGQRYAVLSFVAHSAFHALAAAR